MWSKHFYSYCIFNTFDKIRVFVRTIILFIHLASDLYMIHSAFSRTSPNSTPVTDVHCTNPVIDNKRSRNDQKKIFKNTFKNRKLPTILTIWSFQRWNRTKFRLSDKTNCSKLELVCITKKLTGLKRKKTGRRFHVIWMLQNRLSVIFRALRGHEFLAHSISWPELNSRIESFECDGSCNHYRGQDPEASLAISGEKQTTARGPTIARLRCSFVLHRQHKLGWPWRRLPLLSSHAGYWKYDKSEILQLKFEFCIAHRRVATCKQGKPGLTSFSETLALFFIQFLSFRKMRVQDRQNGPSCLPENIGWLRAWLKSVWRRENLENYESYLALAERAVKEEI